MEQKKSFLEVVNSEKQMLTLIYLKGILHGDVWELYSKIRTGYEKILLNSNQVVERQEVEYHLWKLHYVLIDEFRKKIRQQSENIRRENPSHSIDSRSNTVKSLEGFKSFLSEATEFYAKLIVKLRKSCGLPAEIFLDNKNQSSFFTKQTELHACQHTCHRLLICLGDLARYTEIAKQPDVSEWSTAATYYLEATRTWPDSGNPHNQLALLATYVGDPFLALYHCVRSLAVKEPFPDAWRNIMLLFEENRSAKLQSLSSQMQLDFLNPSKRSYLQNTDHEENGSQQDSISEDVENVCPEKFHLWPILVRTVGYLLTGSSLEEFPYPLASALHSLESLLAMDDTRLGLTLESYQKMDSSRRGPYHAIQLVSMFIFVVHSLTESQEREESKEKDDQKHPALTPLAFAAIFICMGRLTERCLRGINGGTCPLLPAVLVFLEWLVGALDTVEAYDADEKVVHALSYYFGALAGLLDRIEQNGKKTPLDHTALWEDHELRGFYPLARVHEMLDFTSHMECMDNYSIRNQCRSQRIYHAATRIMDMSKSSWEQISYGKVGRVFNSVKTTEFLDQDAENAASVSSHEVKEPDAKADGSPRNKGKPMSEEIESCSDQKTQHTMEEEEVILFKPITRRNSAPLYISKPAKDPVCPEGTEIQTTLADEWLRRATSLSSGQNTEDTDSFSFCSTTSNSGHKRSFKQKEPLVKDSTTHPTGPPSLSAWVLSRGSSNIERDKGLNDFDKLKLSPIDEMASTSFSDLSINDTTGSGVGMGHISTIIHSSSPCVTPTPSAPLLPDDAAWMRENSLISPEYKTATGNEADGILGAPPIGGYIGRSTVRPPVGFVPGLSGLVDGYPPYLGMSSSEWLYHYRNSQNMPVNHLSPIHYSAPAFGNFHPHELSSFDLCDQWGNHLVSSPMLYFGSPQIYPESPLVYGAEEQKRDKFFLGYQRPFPYVCGIGRELSSEQPPLLQHLKEKERQLQPGSQLRGPTFMGN
ncbi:protein SMG7L [Sesamum indicum]|uniref:Protein SMG7L n=1 Tax=Sesamum indicum TaxID=4182 RepID=A0A6I9UEF3_SESIN|nr:protein SMG7L [Sesamum indicum]XP_011096316.1 protein SMG7L [Sesamum indicum]XP_020553945.1 protein SMG7L [Sesamum indicum]